jgi:DNA-binding transcriptional ArsR family regulator
MCVCDLSDVLGMKQSPISQHLRKLKDGGLLENKRDGMTIFYFIPSKMKITLKNIIESN